MDESSSLDLYSRSMLLLLLLLNRIGGLYGRGLVIISRNWKLV